MTPRLFMSETSRRHLTEIRDITVVKCKTNVENMYGVVRRRLAWHGVVRVWMYVHGSTCVRVCVCVCIDVCMPVCLYLSMSECVHARMCVWAYIAWMSACMYASMRTCMYVRTYVRTVRMHVSVFVRTHACMYLCTCISMHVRLNLRMCVYCVHARFCTYVALC